jgi:hypothetical protein
MLLSVLERLVQELTDVHMPQLSLLPDGYTALLEELKERIRNAQVRAALAVN